MNRVRRDLAALFVLSLTVRLAVAALIPRPGYMDAAYYAAGAVHLAGGGGVNDPFLWNYLDDPTGIPHPGFLYWMPLPSLLAAPFASLFPGSFFALQLPFALLSALLPLVAYGLAWEVAGRHRAAWLASLLTLFSGFFFPYWTLPETFAPFALFGSLALWLAGRWRLTTDHWLLTTDYWLLTTGYWLLTGLLVGLAHLTRADGILLLPVVALVPLAFAQPHNAQHATRAVLSLSKGNTQYVTRSFIVHCSLILLGYLLAMAPWFLRNLSLIGTPLSPAGTKTLWLRTYDDIFCYGCALSPRSYLAWGWGNIWHSKLWALGVNLERFLAEDCLVFLLPFVLVGLYRLRHRLSFTLALIYFFLIYFLHSLAFTFPGPRGGFFHASAPALPFLFAAAAEGLEATLGWAARHRSWKRGQAQLIFGTATVVAAVILSGYATAGKLLAWRSADQAYLEIDVWLDGHDVPDSTMVMVGNPPAFWYHTRRPAVVVPNGDSDALLEVCARYRADYVVLDENRPGALAGVYEGARVTGLRLMATFDGARVRLYRRVEGPEGGCFGVFDAF
ncbi:MAG: ArnT family glycosyltransferase [Anaerolineae bacterium]